MEVFNSSPSNLNHSPSKSFVDGSKNIPSALSTFTPEELLSLGFKHSPSNVYTRKIRLQAEEDVSACECYKRAKDMNEVVDVVCLYDDTCSNRKSQIECLAGFCKKKHCANMRLQKNQRSSVKIVDAAAKGRGIVCTTVGGILKGALIDEYVGEVINEAEHEKRMELYSAAGGHFYMMGLGRGEYLDAARYGNAMRFLNHSCSPNAKCEFWSVAAETRIAVVATRRIAEEEEVTIDYGWGRAIKGTVCACGDKLCRFLIGLKSELASSLKAMPTGEWQVVREGDLGGGGILAAGVALVGKWVRIFWEGDKGMSAADEKELDEDVNAEDDLDSWGKLSWSIPEDVHKRFGSYLSSPKKSLRNRRFAYRDEAASGCWYSARILSYDPVSRLHKVLYTADGEETEENLLEALPKGILKPGIGVGNVDIDFSRASQIIIDGDIKEPSPFFVLKPVVSRADLLDLLSRSVAAGASNGIESWKVSFPKETISTVQSLQSILPIRPSCPVCDFTPAELETVPLVFPDDRRTSSASRVLSSSPSSPSSPALIDTNFSIQSSFFDEDAITELSTLVVPRDTPKTESTQESGMQTSALTSPPPQTNVDRRRESDRAYAVLESERKQQQERDRILQEAEKEKKERETAALAEAGARVKKEISDNYKEFLDRSFKLTREAQLKRNAEASAADEAKKRSREDTSTSFNDGMKKKRVASDQARTDLRKAVRESAARRKAAKIANNRFAPPSIDVTSSSLLLSPIVAAIPSYPFISLTPFAVSDSPSRATTLLKLVASLTARVSSAAGSSELLGRALILAMYACPRYVRNDSMDVTAAAFISLAASAGQQSPLAFYDRSSPLVHTLTHACNDEVASRGDMVDSDARGAIMSDAILNSINELSTKSIPPALVFCSFGFAVGSGSSDISSPPLPQPFSLAEEATTVVLDALFSSTQARKTMPSHDKLAAFAQSEADALKAALAESSGIHIRAFIAATMPVFTNSTHSSRSSSDEASLALKAAVRSAACSITLWSMLMLPSLWGGHLEGEMQKRISHRAVAVAVAYTAAAVVLPGSIFEFLNTCSRSYETHLRDSPFVRLFIESLPRLHLYATGNRWAEAIRSLRVNSSHVIECSLALTELTNALSQRHDEKPPAIFLSPFSSSSSGKAAGSIFGKASQLFLADIDSKSVEVLASKAASMTVISSFTDVEAFSSRNEGYFLSDISDLESAGVTLIKNVTDLRTGREVTLMRVKEIHKDEEEDEEEVNAIEDDANLLVCRIEPREILLALRLNAGRWEDLITRQQESKRVAKASKTLTSATYSSMFAIKLQALADFRKLSPEMVENTEESVISDEAHWGSDLSRLVLSPLSAFSASDSATSPSAISSSSSSSGVASSSSSLLSLKVRTLKAPRHPHFILPLHLVKVADGLGAAFEVCPHSLSSFATLGVLSSLHFETRVRIAYQLLRAVARAEDRGVVLHGICPSSVLLDANGHVKLDTYGSAEIVSEYTIKKSMYLMKEHRDEKSMAALLNLFSKQAIKGGKPMSASTSFDWSLPSTHRLLTSLYLDGDDYRAESNITSSSSSDETKISMNIGEGLNPILDFTCLSPELLLGAPIALPTSDVWAFSICAALLLCSGVSPFPSLHKVSEMHVSLNAGGAQPREVIMRQGRVLAAIASIESVLGPISSLWTLSSKLPGAEWTQEALSIIRAADPSIAPVPVNVSKDALHNNFMNRGLSSQAALLLCSGLKIDPVERATSHELVSSSFWQMSESTSTSTSGTKATSSSAMVELDEALIAQAREKLSVKFGLDLKTMTESSLSDQDTSLLSILPATRWWKPE
jgi:serine/threonine protein kinase